jgi:glycosyltransferase involved in cell wall biosynthesis
MQKNKKYNKDISVVLGSYNRSELIKLTIESVREEIARASGNISFEIIVIDGGSDDGSLDWLIKQKDIITIVQHNRGLWSGEKIERKSWGYFMNLGFKIAKGRFICMISDDCILNPNAIIYGLDFFEKKLNEGINLGAVAFYFNDYPIRKKYAVANNLEHLYVNHGLFLKKALEEIDYADEDNFMFYAADTDIILEMELKGYKCLACEESFVSHYNDENIGVKKTNMVYYGLSTNADEEALLQKWKNVAFKESDLKKYRKNIGFWKYSEVNFENTIGLKFDSVKPMLNNKKQDNQIKKLIKKLFS